MSANSRSDGPDDACFEAAAIWHARMAEPGRADAESRAFEAWFAADPDHRLAYEEVARLDALLDGPLAQVRRTAPSVLPQAARSRKGGNATRRTVLRRLAAGFVVAAGAGAAWQQGVVDDLRSDHVAAVGERSTAVLPDGSRVVLNTDTALAVAFGPEARRVTLYRGEACFEVAHEAGPPFLVDAAGLGVRALGTTFAVRADRPSVGVVQGTVEVDTGADGVTLLSSGEQIVCGAGECGAVLPFDAATELAWQRGQIVFYRTPLARVVDELDRYHRGRIVVLEPALGALEVSGIFGTEEPLAALATIREILGVTVTHVTDRLILVS